MNAKILLTLASLLTIAVAENLAKGRPVDMISSMGTPGSRCVDGKYAGREHVQTCHTEAHINPWILIRLDAPVRVRTVVITNRESALFY